MKLSWLVKLSTELLKISFCAAVSLCLWGFSSLLSGGGRDLLPLYLPNVEGFRGMPESGSEKWLEKLTSYGRKWLKPPQLPPSILDSGLSSCVQILNLPL